MSDWFGIVIESHLIPLVETKAQKDKQEGRKIAAKKLLLEPRGKTNDDLSKATKFNVKQSRWIDRQVNKQIDRKVGIQ